MGILVLWVMSSMVEMEPLTLLDQTDRSAVQLIGTRHQCNEKFTELNRAIINSNSCRLDSDCALVMDSSLTFNQCFISVQRGKAELVSAKLGDFKTHCRHTFLVVVIRLPGRLARTEFAQSGISRVHHGSVLKS